MVQLGGHGHQPGRRLLEQPGRLVRKHRLDLLMVLVQHTTTKWSGAGHARLGALPVLPASLRPVERAMRSFHAAPYPSFHTQPLSRLPCRLFSSQQLARIRLFGHDTPRSSSTRVDGA